MIDNVTLCTERKYGNTFSHNSPHFKEREDSGVSSLSKKPKDLGNCPNLLAKKLTFRAKDLRQFLIKQVNGFLLIVKHCRRNAIFIRHR